MDSELGILKRLKEEVIAILEDLCKKKIISQQKREQLEEDIKSRKLRIGIIGQTKHGKSTILNALIFKKEVLPVDVIPSTAGVIRICYGEKEKAIVHFLTQDEGRKANTDKGKYLSHQTPSNNIPWGKEQEVTLSQINKYCAEGGPYTPYVKEVVLEYSQSEDLKSAEILDLPGLNDLNKLREGIALDQIPSLDVVLFILYADKPFDTADRKILLNEFGSTGRLILVLNKIDCVDGFPDIGIVENYVRQQKKRTENSLKAESSKRLFQEILKESPLVPCSAQMALFSSLSPEEIEKDEDKRYHRNRFLKKGIKPEDFWKLSRFDSLQKEVNALLKHKRQVIAGKALSEVEGILAQRQKGMVEEIASIKTETDFLKESVEKIEEEVKCLKDLKKRFEKKIGDMVEGIKNKLSDIDSDAQEKWQEAFDGFYKKTIEETEENPKESSHIISLNLRPLTASYKNRIRNIKEKYRRIFEDFKKESDVIYTTELSDYAGEAKKHLQDAWKEYQELYRKSISTPELTEKDEELLEYGLGYRIPLLGWFLRKMHDRDEYQKKFIEKVLKKLGESFALEFTRECDSVTGPIDACASNFDKKVIAKIQAGIGKLGKKKKSGAFDLEKEQKELERREKELEDLKEVIQSTELKLIQLKDEYAGKEEITV